MSKPVEYCLNQDVRVLALVNAMRIVVARQERREKRPAERAGLQMKLAIERKGK